MHSLCIIVSSEGRLAEEIRERQVASTEEEVVDGHNANDGALEDGVATKKAEEAVGGGHDSPVFKLISALVPCIRRQFADLPGHNGKGDEKADELSTNDIDVARSKTRHVGSKRDDIARD